MMTIGFCAKNVYISTPKRRIKQQVWETERYSRQNVNIYISLGSNRTKGGNYDLPRIAVRAFHTSFC